MRKALLLIIITVIYIVVMQSCRRNYEVKYSRIAVDTLQHNDFDSIDEAVEEEPELDIYEIPKNITAGEVMKSSNRKAAKDAERIFSGGEVGE